MATPSLRSRRVCFGEFELDLSTRELWANGAKQTLAPQPFQILQLLIERPGEVITRDTLVRHLWSSDTFVDFEQGLKKAVNRLREALKDSADQPRFIETLPRQGYRFIAEVYVDTPVVDFEGARPKLGPVAVAEKPRASVSARSLTVRHAPWLIALVALIVLGIGMLLTRNTSDPGVPRVLDITALTNDGLKKYSLATDQQRLFFVERVGDKSLLTQMSANGGELARLEVPFADPFVFDFSSTRAELLVGGDVRAKHRELWAVPVPAGAPHRVGDLLIHEAAWAPDGIHIVYGNNHDLWLANYDSSESRRLLTLPEIPFGPRISPSGDEVLFTVLDPADGLSVWITSLDGRSQPKKLFEAQKESSHCCAIMSPDGRYLFFLTWLINQRLGKDIWVARRKTSSSNDWSQPARLTNGPIGFSNLAISSDGTRLFAVGTQARAELVRYNVQSKSFEPFLNGISAGDVDISTDGQWATYVLYPEMTLWRSRVDGSERTQLTFPPIEAFLPRWSPDGTHIIFTDLKPGRPNRIYIVATDGGTPQPLLPEDHDSEIDATWSPDGNSVVFARPHLAPDLAIYEANFKTREVQKVPGSEERTSPRLSPDGRFIAAISRDWTTMFLYDRTTQQWRQLGKANSVGYPSWSADSKWLYAREGQKVVRLNPASGESETVLDLKDFPEPGTSWTAVTPQGDILLHRDQSTKEIYRLTLQYPK